MRTTERKEVLKHFFSNESTTLVDDQIDAVIAEMERVGVNSAEYSELLSHLERLSKIQGNSSRSPVSGDTIAMIFGNLMGILLIVAYEQKHVMTSKGFSQIIRPKGA